MQDLRNEIIRILVTDRKPTANTRRDRTMAKRHEPLTQDAAAERAIRAVLDSLDSAHTKRAYERHLREFFTWHRETGERAISKESVQRYAEQLQRGKLSPATVNQKLSAIRTLALHAAGTGALDAHIADGIKAVRGVKRETARPSGHALTKEKAQKLLNAPDAESLKGLRDRAILALLIGCGLRRSEVVSISFADIRRRGGRWAIINVGEPPRTVPIPAWASEALNDYRDAVRDAKGTAYLPAKGIVFHPVNRGDNVTRERMTEQAVYNLVGEYASAAGLGSVTPNDLRLTFAKLAHTGGSALDQIQLSLGHGSIQATQRYLGIEQDLTDAPGDHLGLRMSK